MTDPVAAARADGRTLLTEVESKQLLDGAGIRVTQARLATDADDAVTAAEAIGFPVVLKISSPDILHKSDAGGVLVGLADAESVREGYRSMTAAVKTKNPDAKIDGVLVQEMGSGGIETIVGVTNRPPFGPVVAFGLGGIFVEP